MRVALASAAALLLAGCSSEMSRFADDGRNDLTPTASIPQSPGQSRSPLLPGGDVNGVASRGALGAGALASSSIQSKPLAPVQTRSLAPVTAKAIATQRPALSAPATPSPQASLRQTAPAPLSTGSIQKPASVASWSAEGGTPIIVAQGETASMLATRYGVPTEALLRTNGFSSAAQVQPGARVIVPVYTGARAAAEMKPAPVRQAVVKPEKPAKQAATTQPKEKLKFVKGPEPAAKTQQTPAKPAKVAHAKPAKADKSAKIEKPEKVAKPEKLGKPVETAAKIEKPAKQQVAEAKAAKKTADKSAPNVDRETTTGTVDPATSNVGDASDKPEFRWPARGRVIQGFKAGANDGINIALPEGTSVKAAEGGTVAYAGSELKGYGNMVLIRHPNGYVSAYANNGDIAVKRGDKVTRGQTIAKSGQTGNVASPQLHFELRKGSTPVDPTGYLAGL